MGATRFIATDEDKDWATEHAGSIDLIVSTVSSPKMPIAQYLQLLGVFGKLIQVGAPEDVIPGFNCFALIGKGSMLGGSSIGAPHEIKEMLQLAADQKVQAWIEERPMADANPTMLDMQAGKARYRYTLVNKDD